MELQNKNSSKIILQERDTQTSFASKSMSSSVVPDEKFENTATNNTSDNIISVVANAENDKLHLRKNLDTINSSLDFSQLNEISEVSSSCNQISLFDQQPTKINKNPPSNSGGSLYGGLSLDVVIFHLFV